MSSSPSKTPLMGDRPPLPRFETRTPAIHRAPVYRTGRLAPGLVGGVDGGPAADGEGALDHAGVDLARRRSSQGAVGSSDRKMAPEGDVYLPWAMRVRSSVRPPPRSILRDFGPRRSASWST